MDGCGTGERKDRFKYIIYYTSKKKSSKKNPNTNTNQKNFANSDHHQMFLMAKAGTNIEFATRDKAMEKVGRLL